ncbi:MAG: N-acetyltransferase family protein [Planctomycetaceae bacterium]
MAGGLEIRRCVPTADAGSIAWLTEFAHDDDRPPPRAAGMAAELTSRPGRGVESWLALRAGSPVGLVALVSADAGAGVRHSVAWLFVGRGERRRGIATALVATALQSARDRGAAEVWVETRSDWPAATGFWAAIGFRPAG